MAEKLVRSVLYHLDVGTCNLHQCGVGKITISVTGNLTFTEYLPAAETVASGKVKSNDNSSVRVNTGTAEAWAGIGLGLSLGTGCKPGTGFRNHFTVILQETVFPLPSRAAQVIGAGAFKGCVKLAKFILGKTVKYIGKNAFNGCKTLMNIEVKTTKLSGTNVGDAAFKGINKKATFKCQKKLKVYKKLFTEKGALKTCTFIEI